MNILNRAQSKRHPKKMPIKIVTVLEKDIIGEIS